MTGGFTRSLFKPLAREVGQLPLLALPCSSMLLEYGGGGGGMLRLPYKRVKIALDGIGSSGKSSRNKSFRRSRSLLGGSFVLYTTVSFGIRRFDRRRLLPPLTPSTPSDRRPRIPISSTVRGVEEDGCLVTLLLFEFLFT